MKRTWPSKCTQALQINEVQSTQIHVSRAPWLLIRQSPHGSIQGWYCMQYHLLYKTIQDISLTILCLYVDIMLCCNLIKRTCVYFQPIYKEVQRTKCKLFLVFVYTCSKFQDFWVHEDSTIFLQLYFSHSKQLKTVCMIQI